MVTSRSSDYDYDYSSSSSDEDSKVPEMNISTAESRAKMDQSLKKSKEAINGMSLDQLKTAHAEEEEPVWEPRNHKIKPHRLTREIERLVEDDLEAGHKKEEYWDAMYNDPDEREDFGDDSNSDSEEEREEDSRKDDDGDEESDESDD
ncbi:nuclear polyadenylated RNA-binding protein 3-like [Papaver somniferum]|uniref:nuclear polyadenylated RNA-binding protein 3-like n=1 Tax=Papaver somniferum TaxID=3469 RepID=UPI000E6FE83D|nr:nuclear polyadenylated RNA-binding protein 3-like [Papaver somniferum]